MAKTSAGVVLFRGSGPNLEVLLVHPGGPFWKSKSDGVWSIPKGEVDPEIESAADAAVREFAEELGHEVPTGDRIDLGEVTQKAGKRVVAFAVRGDLDPGTVVSNTFTLEWPPKSGRMAEFPEVDRADWFTLAAARTVINSAQVALLERLEAALR